MSGEKKLIKGLQEAFTCGCLGRRVLGWSSRILEPFYSRVLRHRRPMGKPSSQGGCFHASDSGSLRSPRIHGLVLALIVMTVFPGVAPATSVASLSLLGASAEMPNPAPVLEGEGAGDKGVPVPGVRGGDLETDTSSSGLQPEGAQGWESGIGRYPVRDLTMKIGVCLHRLARKGMVAARVAYEAIRISVDVTEMAWSVTWSRLFSRNSISATRSVTPEDGY